MDQQRAVLNKLETIEKLQGQILYYIRVIAEHNGTGTISLPENYINDEAVMFKLSWSKSTLKRRRAEGLLPYKKIRNKYYYKERDVVYLLFPDGPQPSALPGPGS
jgi:hypothetical protein